MMPLSEIQVNVRMPEWLKKEVQEDAKRSGWSVSSQIRYELLERRGKAPRPFLPMKPNQGKPTRRKHIAA